MVQVEIAPHPLLDVRVHGVTFAAPLGSTPTPAFLRELLAPGAPGKLESDDDVRAAVRDLLRHGGYKPTGRGKPSSEYLIRAVADGQLSSINVAVDLGNALSLHSGLPISVVDLDRTRPPLRVAIAPPDASYVFNATGQTIALDGLLCLADADGPCANAVKDAQRTKTGAGTTSTAVVLWGTKALAGRSDATSAWLSECCARIGARFELLARS